jgi:tRNA(Arg) A34 adenosine deaminase TadA
MSSNVFMARAIELSINNVKDNGGGPFGAVIVKDNNIIGEGWNQVTSNNDPTAHAEVQAIRNACSQLQSFNLSGCNIYTSCEPCPMCLAAIYWAKIDKIYFACTKEDATLIGFDDEFIYDEIEKSINDRQIIMKQFMHLEGLKAFEAWKNKTDKVLY